MTDVLDPVELESPEAGPSPVVISSLVLDDRSRVVLASLSVAAAVVHAGMAPSHAGESLVEGAGFAAAAWLQLLTAWAILRRPSRAWLRATVALNLALVGAWAVSRTAGLPFGENSGHEESVSVVDLTTVAVELVLVLAVLGVLRRPLRAVRIGSSNRLFAATVPVALAALISGVLLSPSARDHASASHGDHGDDHAAALFPDGDDKGFAALHNGHHAEIVAYDLDPASQAALDEQLAITREVARRLGTVADAEAAGYKRAGPYSPGLGSHYVIQNRNALNADGVMDTEDLQNPLGIIYEGNEPTSKVAGFMYFSISKVEPQGFVGRNDVWHVHEDLCLKNGANGEIEAPFGADKQATPEQCAQVGGYMLKVTQWMLHVWSVPGWENANGGVFGEHNPKLTCPDGTYHQIPPEEWAASPLTTCRRST